MSDTIKALTEAVQAEKPLPYRSLNNSQHLSGVYSLSLRDFDLGDLPQDGPIDDHFNSDWFDLPNGTAVPNWNTLVSDLRANDFSYSGMF